MTAISCILRDKSWLSRYSQLCILVKFGPYDWTSVLYMFEIIIKFESIYWICGYVYNFNIVPYQIDSWHLVLGFEV
uniref:Uncharacterized protein n=1 Tax=Rhizophora mucronata TaxID=61149 RepID=A0A2P2K7K1_RHIMU